MGYRQSEKASVFARGPRQTNYTTEVAPASSPKNYRWITKDGYAKAGFRSNSIDNAGQSTGSALPDKVYKDRDETDFQADEQLTFQLLGLLANDAYGVTAAPVVVVASQAWKHVFSLLDPFVSAVLPSRPIVSKVGESNVVGNTITDARLPSMVVETWTISDGGNLPNLLSSISYRGSGQYIEDLTQAIPSGVKFYGTGRHVFNRAELGAEVDIPKRSGIATIYPLENFGGTAISTECIVRGFTQTINSNLNVEGGYGRCGRYQDNDTTKGAIADTMNSTGQTVSLEITIVADADAINDFDLIERVKSGDAFSMKMAYKGALITGTTFHLAEFKLSKASIASFEWVPLEGGEQGLRIVTTPLATGNTLPLTLELTTNVENFNTYIAPA